MCGRTELEQSGVLDCGGAVAFEFTHLMRGPRGFLTQTAYRLRPPTNAWCRCSWEYFSDSALGITLARQTADRGLKKQPASPAEQNAL